MAVLSIPKYPATVAAADAVSNDADAAELWDRSWRALLFALSAGVAPPESWCLNILACGFVHS